MWAPILFISVFFFFLFLMLNYIILVKWNYRNDKKVTPERFILNYAQNLCVGGGGGGRV